VVDVRQPAPVLIGPGTMLGPPNNSRNPAISLAFGRQVRRLTDDNPIGYLHISDY